MKLLDRLFRRSGRRADQQDELDYRMALSEVRRQAAAMRREVERCRSEAYRLEMSGDREHIRALTAHHAFDLLINQLTEGE